MTKLIYRGVAHDGAMEIAGVATMALTYRGVAHDGTSVPAAATSATCEMVYRGVPHSRSEGAALAVTPSRAAGGTSGKSGIRVPEIHGHAAQTA